MRVAHIVVHSGIQDDKPGQQAVCALASVLAVTTRAISLNIGGWWIIVPTTFTTLSARTYRHHPTGP